MSLHTGLDQVDAGDLPSFSVGLILWRSFWITVASFFRFVGLALVIAIPAGVAIWLLENFLPVKPNLEISNYRIVTPTAPTLAMLLIGLLAVLAVLMVQAAVCYRAFRALGGTSVDFGDCLARALGTAILLVEFAIVASIVLGAFAVLAVWETAWFVDQGNFNIAGAFGALIGGVVIYIIIGSWVVFPAIVVERIGPIAAIFRSWQLTRGRRWQILVLLVLFAAIEFAISHLFTLKIELGLIGPYAAYVFNLPLSFLGTVLLTVSYYHLVGEKEGTSVLRHIFA